jgi:hypothetical protein
MDDDQANHLNDDQDKYAGDPVDDDLTDGPDAEPKFGQGASFTPRPGRRHDGGWQPDEYPHGDPKPGPSLEDDPGARGPEARTALDPNPPVPPEAVVEDRGDDPDNIDERSGARG